MAIDLTQGTDIALRRNDATGRFDFDFTTTVPGKGNPRLTNDKTHAVMTTVFSWKRGKRPGEKLEAGGYYLDTTGRRGTLLWTLVNDTTTTRSQLLGCADDAGQQLVADKHIISLTAEATRVRPGRWALAIQWVTPSADRKETLTL